MKDALVYALVALAREVLWWLTRPQPATGAEPDPDQSRYTRTWDQLEAFAMHTPDSAVAGLGAVIHHAMAVDLQFASKVVDLIEAEFVESEHA